MVQVRKQYQGQWKDSACIIRGDIDLTEMERFKFWTDGERNLVFLGITKCGKADEGNYKCVLSNRFGKREHKFKLFVSSESLVLLSISTITLVLF